MFRLLTWFFFSIVHAQEGQNSYDLCVLGHMDMTHHDGVRLTLSSLNMEHCEKPYIL